MSDPRFDNSFGLVQAIAVFRAGDFRIGLEEGVSVDRVQFTNQVGRHLKATIGERCISRHDLQRGQGNRPPAKSKLEISGEV